MKKKSKLTKEEQVSLAWKTRRENGNDIPYNKKECEDVEKLKELYIVEKKGSHAIAKELGVTQRLIMLWLHRYNIPIRTRSDASMITKNGFKSEEKHVNWAGDKVSYSAIHAWIRKKLGTPQKCEHCGSTSKKKYEWANISGKYLRNLNDWIRLCTSCHRHYDKNKLKKTYD